MPPRNQSNPKPVQNPGLEAGSETVSEPDDNYDQPLPAVEQEVMRADKAASEKSDQDGVLSQNSKNSIHKEEPAGTKRLRTGKKGAAQKSKKATKRAKTADGMQADSIEEKSKDAAETKAQKSERISKV